MKIIVEIDGVRHTVELPEGKEVVRAVVDGGEVEFSHRKLDQARRMFVIVDHRPHMVDVEPFDGGLRIFLEGRELNAVAYDERTEALRRIIGAGAAPGRRAGEVRAPMPGLVVKLLAEEGQRVTRGQGVIVVEAMKMENEIPAPIEGTVREIKVQPGQAVDKNELLLTVERDDEQR